MSWSTCIIQVYWVGKLTLHFTRLKFNFANDYENEACSLGCTLLWHNHSPIAEYFGKFAQAERPPLQTIVLFRVYFDYSVLRAILIAQSIRLDWSDIYPRPNKPSELNRTFQRVKNGRNVGRYFMLGSNDSLLQRLLKSLMFFGSKVFDYVYSKGCAVSNCNATRAD